MSNARATKRRARAAKIQIRILQRVPGTTPKKGEVLDLDDFKDEFPKYADANIDETWAFNSANSKVFQLMVNGRDVNNVHSSVKRKAAKNLTFGGAPVSLDDDGDVATCRGFNFDVSDIEDIVNGAADAADIDEIGGKSVTLMVKIGCCTGTVAELAAIVDAADALKGD